jgi:beta-lactamase regulating signal transducer with metallopeptidase domain
MTMILFLAEWALRSSVLILTGALLLRMLGVKDASIRLAAWIAVLCGSLAIPVINILLPSVMPNVLPNVPLAVMQTAARPVEALGVVREAVPALISEAASRRDGVVGSKPFDWALAAVGIYMLVAGALLLRLCLGLAMSRRLLGNSRATGRRTAGIEIRESDAVAAPVALGIVRSVIVLPGDWREWDGAKLEAVLAHECSHVRRKDPAVQLLSAIHRALLWHSPLSWFLHRRIVRVAEEASDDAAVSAMRDRASYAEVLLEFMQRGVRGGNWQGVAMARYGRPDERIHRILEGTALSRGVTRWSVAAILVLGLPVVYLAAAARTQVAAVEPIEGSKADTAPFGHGSATKTPEAAATFEAPESVAATVQSASAAAPVAQVAAVDAQAAGAAVPAQAAATAQAGSAAAEGQHHGIRRYMVVSGSTMSGSWDSGDGMNQEGLREKFGSKFAWFRQGGNDYIVTDAGVLAELEQAMEPQKEVNRMQHGVNDQQAEVNKYQADVNRAQGDVNAIQAAVNRRQHLINELQAAKGDDDLIRKLEATLAELKAQKGEANDQEAANRAQAKVNEMQARVNEEQGKVNEQQHKVNEEQGRVSAKMDGRIEEILDSAVRRRLVQQMP